jgi:hypothetical protein
LTLTLFPVKKKGMGKSKVLELSIGIVWTASAGPANAASLEPFLEAFAQTPLTWVLCAGATLEKRSEEADKLVAEIKARMANIGDSVIPAGYSGAPHPLLGLSELERELEWSLRNPWGSGLADVFKKTPGMMIPTAADFSRDRSRSLYLKLGFRFIGLPFDPSTPVYRFWGHSPEEGLTIFHYFDAGLLPGNSAARTAKSFFPRDLDRALVLVRTGGRESLAALSALIDALRAQRACTITGLAEPGEPPHAAHNPAPLRPALLIDTPLARLLREKAGRLRAKDELKNHELRELLTLTAADPLDIEKARSTLEKKPVAREGTAYNANMPGEILLPGSAFDACFSRGRLTDLKAGETGFLPGRPAQGSALVAGKELPLIFDRIFSFEKNDLRGLETFILFPGAEREHFFTIRYAFSGEQPWLFICGELVRRFSAPLDRIGAFAPLEIPLGEILPDAPLVIRQLYADGSQTSTALTGHEETVVIPGTVFSAPSRGRHLVFGYVPHKTAPIHCMAINVHREKKKKFAYLNPFGAFGNEAVRAMLATGEARPFYIGVRDAAPEKPPAFSASLLKSIPPHSLHSLA